MKHSFIESNYPDNILFKVENKITVCNYCHCKGVVYRTKDMVVCSVAVFAEMSLT